MAEKNNPLPCAVRPLIAYPQPKCEPLIGMGKLWYLWRHGSNERWLNSNLRLYWGSLEWCTQPGRWKCGPLPPGIYEVARHAEAWVDAITALLARLAAPPPSSETCRNWMLRRRHADG